MNLIPRFFSEQHIRRIGACAITGLIVFSAVALAAMLRTEDSSRPVVAQTDDTAQIFQRVWQRTDAPVETGAVSRTWIWGPPDRAVDVIEPYAEAPAGVRAVRYFDKSRMELTDANGNRDSPWFVTNGLLVHELATGRRQLGDADFEQRHPATVPVAGDSDNVDVPTYAILTSLMDQPARVDRSVIVERAAGDGTITIDPELAIYGVTSAMRVSVPGIDHQVASVFWDFMNGSGPVMVDGQLEEDFLFSSPFFATGFPLTEAYWVTARLGGIEQTILFQAFERRVLTYTPGNPDGWTVESGNVGLHYYKWLYGDEPAPESTPTSPLLTPAPTAEPAATATYPPTAPGIEGTPTSPPSETRLITVGPGAVDAWMRSVVRDGDHRLWIVAINNNLPRQGAGPGSLVIYRAATTGVPEGFEAVGSGAVKSNAVDGEIVFADAAIDGAQRLHIVWVDRGQSGVPLLYGIFDTKTMSWEQLGQVIDETGLEGFGGNAGQGGVSIALATDGSVRVAYIAAGNHTQVRVREQSGEGWGDYVEPLRLEGSFVWHPALALGADSTWHLVAYDATSNQIVGTRDAGQGWSALEVVSRSVLGPESIDQGPAMLVTPSGIPQVLYVDADSYLRLASRNAGAWSELPVGGDYLTHAPGLGLFADGTLVASGHDEFHPPTGMNVMYGEGSNWSGWEQLVQLEADGSAVFRWAGAFFAPTQEYADLVFFDEDVNNDGVFDDQMLYYVAVPRLPD